MTTITASTTLGIDLNPAFYTSPVVIGAGVIVSNTGYPNAVYRHSGATTFFAIRNHGTIAGNNSGVYLAPGGSVTNGASASIIGAVGVQIHGGAGTVVNDGSIAGRDDGIGVDLLYGGSVTNGASASIIGATGVQIYGGAGTVVSDGSIAGSVHLGSGGSVTNAATASIIGPGGLVIDGGAGIVVNDGSIGGPGGSLFGVGLRSGGSVSNGASAHITGGISSAVYVSGGLGIVVNDGSIAGNNLGVDLPSGGTLTNGGAIIGNSGTAVVFGGTGSNLLVLDAGFGFSGIVDGGASSSNTLELASTASAGTVTGLGSQFTHFGSIVFDAGAQWSITGVQRGLAGPISGFAVGDTIELTGVTATGSSYVGGILTIGEAVGFATLNLPGNFTLANFNVTNNSDGTEVTVTGITLNGGTGNDVLNGGTGNDTLNGGTGADVMSGGTGNDTYYVDNVGDTVTESPNEGTDTVKTTLSSYTLGPNVENLTFIGTGSHAGIGNVLANIITGGAGNDTLNGGAGNDTLNGGAGADTMAGGTGNDTYYVDNVGDTVTESPNEGTDTVKTTLSSYTLGPNVENLTFIGTGSFAGTGNVLANIITGGAGNDTLNGGAGNDTLNGGAGADVMSGGTGNDVYYVDNAADKVNEAAGQGTDTVHASVSYTLTAGSEIEYLRANAGATGLTLTGNALNNTIVGGTGNDTLNGGIGADTMAGGPGNDTYYVDNPGDVVNESAGAGADTVKTTLLSKMLGANLENLMFIGSGNFTGTGNALNNVITGGAGNDTLNGGAGNDTLNGGNGNDVLVGGTGADVLTGGAGADVFRFTALADSTVAAGGRDTIKDFASGDKIDLHLIDANASLPGDQAFSFIGTNAFSGTAGQLRYAASGGNTLISGDVNGNKVANFSILVSGAHAFSGSDFVR